MLYEFLISVQGKRETVNQLRDRPWISLLLQSFLLNELTFISPWNYQTNYLRQQSTNYVSLFDYFVGLVRKDLSYLLIYGDFIFYFDFPLYGWRWKNNQNAFSTRSSDSLHFSESWRVNCVVNIFFSWMPELIKYFNLNFHDLLLLRTTISIHWILDLV